MIQQNINLDTRLDQIEWLWDWFTARISKNVLTVKQLFDELTSLWVQTVDYKKSLEDIVSSSKVFYGYDWFQWVLGNLVKTYNNTIDNV